MPGVFNPSTVESEPLEAVKAELIKLWLPSQLEHEDRNGICVGGITACERELQFAQLEDSLNDLRRARRVRHGLIAFHKTQLAGEGQKIQTRSRAVMSTIQERIDRNARHYCTARNALLRLDPHGDWKDLYLPLPASDNRGPGKEPEEQSGSDGQWAPSWIWRSSTTAISTDEVNEDMHVEWAQCMAHADRWEEEVILLQEEMRRVVQYLQWRSNDWLSKVDSRVGAVSSVVHSGLSAYARKQAAVYHNLAVRFCQCWRSTLVSLSLPHTWATVFLETHKEPFSGPIFREQKRVEVVVCPRTNPPAASTDVPPLQATHKSTVREAQGADSDSDGILSEYDESGYDS